MGGGRPLLRGWLPLLAAALVAVLPSAVRAAEAVSWTVDRRPLAEALAGLGTLTPATPELGFDLATGPGGRVAVTLVLRAAPPAAVRQAVAHAAGTWWATSGDTDPDAADASVLLTTSRRLVPGAPVARTHPSDLLDDQQAEDLVPRLLEPWRGSSELIHNRTSGTWLATLDAGGQRRLIELLSLLQRPQAGAPALLTGMPASDPQRAVAGTLHAGAWAPWCGELALAADLSVSLEPGLDHGQDGAPALTLGGTRADLPRLLAAAGLRAAILHGVLCVGREQPNERLHPALRRRLAVVPLPHLATDDASGTRLAEALRRAVLPTVWREPGWGLEWIASGKARPGFLLVAADPPTIHGVLDAIDVFDRLGVAEGLAALAQ